MLPTLNISTLEGRCFLNHEGTKIFEGHEIWVGWDVGWKVDYGFREGAGGWVLRWVLCFCLKHRDGRIEDQQGLGGDPSFFVNMILVGKDQPPGRGLG